MTDSNGNQPGAHLTPSIKKTDGGQAGDGPTPSVLTVIDGYRSGGNLTPLTLAVTDCGQPGDKSLFHHSH